MLVGAVGIEPTTFGLKGRCSTTELRPYSGWPLILATALAPKSLGDPCFSLCSGKTTDRRTAAIELPAQSFDFISRLACVQIKSSQTKGFPFLLAASRSRISSFPLSAVAGLL